MGKKDGKGKLREIQFTIYYCRIINNVYNTLLYVLMPFSHIIIAEEKQ